MKALQDIYFSNINAVCNTGGKFCCHPEYLWECATHTFDQNKFYFIINGKCNITINGKKHIARAGQWFFIPAGTPHSYSAFKGQCFEKYWMHFDLYPSTSIFDMLELPFFVNVPEGSAVYDLFSQASNAMESNDFTDRIRLKTCLLSLVSEYIKLVYPDGVTIESTNSRIDDVLRYINNNLDHPLSVPFLAATFHLHPTHFIRFFKEKTGQTPAKYIKICRLETAKRLLEDTDLYILEIIENIGLSDESQFSKQFKTYFGYSPRNYRKYFRSNL